MQENNVVSLRRKDGIDDPLTEMNHQMLKSRITDVLQNLPYREREILQLLEEMVETYGQTTASMPHGTIFKFR